MQIEENTPYRARTIGGVDAIQVPAPYTEGYVLSKAEADMLNQTFAENISNNMRAKAKREDGSLLSAEEFQPLVDEYVAKYQPGVRIGGGGGGKRSLSPVETEMRAIATDKLKEILKQKGLKQRDVEFTQLRDKIIEQHSEALRSQAEKIVRAREKATAGNEDILASFAADLPGASTVEPAVQPEPVTA